MVCWFLFRLWKQIQVVVVVVVVVVGGTSGMGKPNPQVDDPLRHRVLVDPLRRFQ